MAPSLACIGSSAVCDALQRRGMIARRLGPQQTPFGESQPVYRCECSGGAFAFLPRSGESGYELAPSFINYRANIYALKSLGVRAIVSWSETRALCHNFKIGQYVVVDDLIDETRSRPQTFFETQGLGSVRQWPVFCQGLRGVLSAALSGDRCPVQERGVYVCTEGPRQESPAEGRKYATLGGELIGQTVAPEVFLARELQMCYATLAYVQRFAETGTDARPFEHGLLLDVEVERQRERRALDRLPTLLERLSAALAVAPETCRCESSMQHLIESGQIGADWRTWFEGVSAPRLARSSIA